MDATPTMSHPPYFLRPPQETPPGPLTRFLRLDVWRGSLLTSRAQKELEAAAALLIVVVLFEALAWSTLFNVIFCGSVTRFGWGTLPAAGLGLLFATVVGLYERSFLTLDLSDSPLKVIGAAGFRMVVIVCSAIATAQPVELMLFDHEINERLKEQAVLAEAATLVRSSEAELDAAKDAASTLALASGTVADTSGTERANKQLSLFETKVNALQDSVVSAQASVQRYDAEVQDLKVRLSGESDPEKRDLMASKLKARTDGLTSARGRVAEVEQKLSAARTEQAQLQSTYARAVAADQDAQRQHLAATQSTMIDAQQKARADSLWIATLWSAPTGTAVERPDGSLIDPYQAGFVERLTILHDLIAGETASWGAISPAVRQSVVDRFGFGEVDSQEARARAASEAETFGRTYYLSFIVACIVPVLTIAYKILLGRELRAYFSLRAQALAGNPDATRVLYTLDSSQIEALG